MAATVINSYSDAYGALINGVAQGASGAGQMPPSNQSRGKTTVGAFTVTLASQVAGEDIALVKIPKGARLLHGTIVASATLANSAQISVGLMGADGTGFLDAAGTVSDDVAALKAAAVQSTTKISFLLTPALKFMYLTEKELWLTITTSVGTVATEVVTGYIEYVVD